METERNFVARARACRSHQDIQDVYAQWADTYDSDLVNGAHDYVAPVIAAETAYQLLSHNSGAVLDAGCGTGLVGAALAKRGATAIDGLDISPHMLRIAETSGAYHNVFLGDLTKEIAKPSQSYELVTCVGTFTHGHVGPVPALRQFSRLLKDGGHIVATVLEELWLPGGFQEEVGKLAAEGLMDVISIELHPYLKGQDRAHVLILRKKRKRVSVSTL
ncbi:S-adenosyl-L-methionine-dependent methyltransferase [Xylaria bambusicola]|uniref:S-adenosyl-L-methionine-dependent methyltransferase n=1 Tax=Xylaria bambusicola TaxID=326684 RepID=UPI0020074559|nr:S-adenosyl-L-methionine-dependent methyltransferase [Xylaria bambusicola]KAI0515181.1 S-adenosyl-L-methionine-dependent methyltransferase [Xylaria bambusicola]